MSLSLQENSILCSTSKVGIYACFTRVNKEVRALGDTLVVYHKEPVLNSREWKAGMANTAFEDKLLVGANSPRAFVLQFIYSGLAQKSFLLKRVCRIIFHDFLKQFLESFYSFGYKMHLISMR